ncbi:MAG: arginyltransferase [Natronospirillum sp.]|uniref:arginyltransferase n=1 Tax=Natronospirillum sp. TaxID=2812955 RepID=UPI0025F9B2B9|nr:arginyltransferase [Natronospirillum sp.]MCH8552643.1 arginyltransferase [Natronospirillum sp.]
MRFFKTSPHDCSYLADRQASTIFLDPAVEVPLELYEKLNLIGFRRSGGHFYRPDCAQCRKCQSIRVLTREFEPRRRHRRIRRKARHLRWQAVPVHYEERYWQLYERYIEQRHPGGDMYPPSQEDFYRFLLQQTQYGFLLEAWEDSQLVLIAVIDQFSTGLSAVYTFYDPDFARYSPGTLSILRQIEICQELGLPYLYLGYWIDSVPNMNYKADFKPVEVYRNELWQPLVEQVVAEREDTVIAGG